MRTWLSPFAGNTQCSPDAPRALSLPTGGAVPDPPMLKYSLAAALLFGAVLLALRWRSSADPALTHAEIAGRVLHAVEQADYDAFIAHADNRVRKMRVEDFQTLAAQHAPRLRTGYEVQPIDERWRGDVLLTRWKLVFKDGGRDAVLTVGLKDGKVATFMIF
jgi:hypothetical protein